MGKTTLGLCIAANIARAGATVAAFSLEMPSRELILRVLAAEGRVDGMALRTGRVSAEQVDHLLAARRRLRGLPLHVDDTAGVGVEHIEAVCARLSARRDAPPLGLVWIDYAQLMSGRGHTREEVVAGNSRGLKALAKRLGVPVLLIAQVNRESEHRANKRPALAELRESGAIEQDADAVLLLYCDEFYDENSRAVGIAEVHVAKNRHGPVGMVELRFFHAWSLFAERDPAG